MSDKVVTGQFEIYEKGLYKFTTRKESEAREYFNKRADKDLRTTIYLIKNGVRTKYLDW